MPIGNNISQVQPIIQDAKAKAAAAKAKILDTQKKAKEMADKAKKIKELADKQKEKATQLKKSLVDKQNFLKDQTQINPTNSKAALVSTVLPILTKFINAEKVANVLLNKIINDTKNKLKDKGRVEVNNGAITFTPKNPGNYDKFKQDFENKVNRLKQAINVLKTIINILISLLKILKVALIAFQVQLSLSKKKLQIEAAASAVNLTTPSPAKPLTAKYTIDDRIYSDVIQPLIEKINNYISMISAVTSILQVFQKMINNIKAKLDLLSLTIIQSGTPTSILTENMQSSINNTISTTTSGNNNNIEEEYNNGDKNYTIKIITSPSGTIQAIAYDSFSMMKITQTAPSKTRTPEQLLEEIKQILG